MSRLDLDQQRKRAKDLLRAHRKGDRAANERIARHLPRLGRALQLADAQLVIAREAGFASWPRLVHHVEPPGMPLHAAVRARDLDGVRTALATAEPWQTREAIEWAIAGGDRAIVREIVAHRGWVDVAGRRFGRWGGGLHAALLLGSELAMIEDLLAGGASIAARDRDGRTPLAIAVRTGRRDAADVLRRAGASDAEVDDVDRALGACIAGEHPARPVQRLRRSDHQHLAWAIRRGHVAALPALLALGLDPNVADDDGSTPLHLAALDVLIAAGARVDALDFENRTPLDRATDPAARERLERAGATPSEPAGLDELFEDAADAIVAGDLARVRALLDREPRLVAARSLRPHRATLLHYVGANGVEDERQKTPRTAPAIAELLIARGADPNALALTYGGGPAQTPLYLAATSDHPERAGVMRDLCKALVAGGARVDDDDRAELHGFYPSALAVLVGRVITVDLWAAAMLGRVEDVRRFLRADGTLAPGAKLGSEASAPDADVVDIAFRAACSMGWLEVVELLIARARLERGDIEGLTGLHLAVMHDRLDVARFLVEHGASVDTRNVYGADALRTLEWTIENRPRPRPNASALRELLRAAGGRA